MSDSLHGQSESGETMFTGACATCRGLTLGDGAPVGIDCPCGRHFHVGATVFIRTDDCIECPSCGTRTTPLAIKERADA